jgi:hypothetical protein
MVQYLAPLRYVAQGLFEIVGLDLKWRCLERFDDLTEALILESFQILEALVPSPGPVGLITEDDNLALLLDSFTNPTMASSPQCPDIVPPLMFLFCWV